MHCWLKLKRHEWIDKEVDCECGCTHYGCSCSDGKKTKRICAYCEAPNNLVSSILFIFMLFIFPVILSVVGMLVFIILIRFMCGAL
ncbi:MAG: hypothetical protein US74_C0044G0010 [Parcubacteria group bacterium GW2011_GWA2_38_13]|nr:MAG: hypothetical protein US74_C0044G0010 [Parcubacteria group bacterium GW2011_GWA2_38_13]